MNKFLVSTALLASLLGIATPVMAEQTFTMPFNYDFTGDVLINELTPGQCVAASTGGLLVSSGAACGGGGGGVASVTGSGNILSSGGANPNITTVAAPTFADVTDSALTPGNCLQAGALGLLTDTGSPCSAGGGAVSSVTSTTPLALTASPTTGAVSIAIPSSPVFGGVVTVGSLAAPGGANIGGTLSLPNIVSAQCLAINGSSNVIGAGVPCGGGPPMILLSNPQSLPIPAGPLAPTTFTGNQFANAPVGMVLGHINVSCATYNAADATAGPSDYSPLDANGLGGGTIDFGIQNATFSGTAPFSLGSVVIPDSPQAGPYVTSVTSTVGTPYTILPGDNIIITVSTVSGTATQWVTACSPYGGP